MDWSTAALTMFLVLVLGSCLLAWLFYSLFCRILRMFVGTTTRTVDFITGKPFRKR